MCFDNANRYVVGANHRLVVAIEKCTKLPECETDVDVVDKMMASFEFTLVSKVKKLRF